MSKKNSTRFLDKKLIFFFLVTFLVILLLYGHYINLFFSQDDFFHLFVSQTDGSLKQFVTLFSFRPFSQRGGIYFYRPIFREGIFNILFNLFGLIPLPFRIIQFTILFFNIVLSYILILKITKDKIISFIASSYVGISIANVGIISYLAGGIQISGMLMFSLISFIFYFKFLREKLKKFRLLSFLFFVLALASHEMAFCLPLIFSGIFIFENGLSKKNILSSLTQNLDYYFTVATFVLLEVFIIGLPTSESQYRLSFSIGKILNSYFWYFIWSLGMPEMLLDFVGPGLKLNPNLMKYWGSFFLIIFTSFSVTIIFLVISFTKLYKSKNYMFFIFWFLVGIVPAVLLPFHKQYYYLGLVLPAIGGVVGLTFKNLWHNKVLSISFLLVILVLTYTSIKLADSTYWAISRSKISKELILQTFEKYPTLPKGANLYYLNDTKGVYLGADWGHSSKQASIALSGSDALRLFYKDNTLKVYYEDLSKPPDLKSVFSLTAVIN